MNSYDFSKWKKLDRTEELLFFALTICELLNESTLDSYKVPALNLFLSIKEVDRGIRDYTENRIKKGAINFSIEEARSRIEHTNFINEIKKGTLLSCLGKIDTLIKSKDKISNEKLNSLSRAMVDELSGKYFFDLKAAIYTILSPNNSKDEIRLFAQEFVTELSVVGFSREYILGITKKFFFSNNVAPKKIVSSKQIFGYLAKFKIKTTKWEVYLKGAKISDEQSRYSGVFNMKLLKRTPKSLASNPKFKAIPALNGCNSLYRISEVKAHDPHSARKKAEERLNTYIDVCRFHNHSSEYHFSDQAIVVNIENKKNYSIGLPVGPMESGVNHKTIEENFSIGETLYTLYGNGFSTASQRTFRKVLDFHHAAMTSTNEANQLLSLWAALEGFLPSPDESGDRITFYKNYIVPILILTHHEKIFKNISRELLAFNDDIRKTIDDKIAIDCEVKKVTCLLTAQEHIPLKNSIIGMLNKNPLLKHRIEQIHSTYCNSKSIRNSLGLHEIKIGWHLQRIYTLRNRIAHNAETLPYVRTLIENIHDYLDTIITSVARISSKSRITMDVHIALEKISISKEQYIRSINNDTIVTENNFETIIFGERNILSTIL